MVGVMLIHLAATLVSMHDGHVGYDPNDIIYMAAAPREHGLRVGETPFILYVLVIQTVPL